MSEIRKDDIIEDFHGTKVADPYRWLEDPKSEDTKQWVKHWQKECDTYFSGARTKKEDMERLEELFDYPKFSAPRFVEGKFFYLRNEGLQNQAVLYVKDGSGEKELIDPNSLSEDGTVAMTNYFISHDGKYVAYALSTHGSDWQEIRVRNVETKEDERDHLVNVKFTNVAWLPDNSGFYYSRYPDPKTVTKEEEGLYNKIYLHKLGTDQEEDRLIFERPDFKELMFSPRISDDKGYLVLHVFHGTASENRVYVMKLDGGGEVIRLLDDFDASYYYVTNEGEDFYFATNLDAPNQRIIKINLENSGRENWEEVIAEADQVIDNFTYINDRFVLSYLHDAHSNLVVHEKTGEFAYEIELPFIGSLGVITKNKDEDKIYFGLTSFLRPATIYEFSFGDESLSILEEAEFTIDTGDFMTEQLFYKSKDGTRVPMFVTRRKDIKLDGSHPTILYGYGGFNISLTPDFNPAVLRWVEKGGIYAVANLRGGNEYGEDWHRAGMLENKQNVFDDFISAGEFLIEEGYTRREKLSIMGGSNGGLLVAACMVQRPDLFGAVICRVPVIDMLRYHKFTIGHFWMGEYGDPDQPEHFKFLYEYSPLHNVKEGETYPPVLIATAESDDRVVPAHAKKFAATLKEKASSDSKIILRLEAKAGHGLGKPTAKIIEEWADFFAFLAKELDMS